MSCIKSIDQISIKPPFFIFVLNAVNFSKIALGMQDLNVY